MPVIPSTTNPELTDDRSTFSTRVQRLFGSAPPVIVRAVLAFLDKSPGELDHHNLRVVAAAASGIGDAQLVAQLIDRIPVTGMYVASVPVDIDESRRHFTQILDRYPATTRQRLVEDLVGETTLQILISSPPDRVTPVGREIVDIHLKKLARGSIREISTAIESQFATTETTEIALREIEKRITRADGQMPFGVVAHAVGLILNATHDKVTDEQVVRAWRASFACRGDGGEGVPSWLISDAVESPRIAELCADSLLDEIDRSGLSVTNRRLRGGLLAMRDLPESVARRAVIAGADWWSIRSGQSPEDDRRSIRLVDVRRFEYSELGSQALMPDHLSSREIDERLCRVPAEMIRTSSLKWMSDRASLDVLCGRLDELSDRQIGTLCGNPHVDIDLLRRCLDSQDLPDIPRRKFSQSMIANPGATDAQLAEIIRGCDRADLHDLVDRAARNTSAGVEVFGIMVEVEARDSSILLARSTVSRELQQEIARSASANDDLELAQGLLMNPTIRNDLVPELQWVGEPRPTGAASEAPFAAQDLVRLIESGEIDGHAIDTLVSISANRQAERQRSAREGLIRLADNGLLSDDHWLALTNMADPRAALLFATHPNCPPAASAVSSAATQKLTEVANHIGASWALTHAGRDQPKRWDDLPNNTDEPLPSHHLAELLDGQVVDGLQLTVPRTQREIDRMSAKMGNCLDGLTHRVRQGTAAVAWTHRGEQTFAIGWSYDGPTDGPFLRVVDVNTDFNTKMVPASFVAAVHEMTSKINDRSLRPVERVQNTNLPDAQLEVTAPEQRTANDSTSADTVDAPTDDAVIEQPADDHETGSRRSDRRATRTRRVALRLQSAADGQIGSDARSSEEPVSLLAERREPSDQASEVATAGADEQQGLPSHDIRESGRTNDLPGVDL